MLVSVLDLLNLLNIPPSHPPFVVTPMAVPTTEVISVTSTTSLTTGMAIQLKGSDEIMVVQSVVSTTEILVLRGAFDTAIQSSAGNDDEINVLGRVDDLVCAPHVCDIDNITNAVVGADYSDCDWKQDGELCAVTCADGYAAFDAQGLSVDALDIPLVCNANGDFNDPSGLVCQPNVCDVNVVANAVAGAEYSSCGANKITAEVCIPSCLPGYGTTKPASTITLVCGPNGVFDGSNDIECTDLGIATFTNGFESGMAEWTTGGMDRPFIRQSGSTLSSGTGPSAAAVGNFYVYAETSYGNHNLKFDLQRTVPGGQDLRNQLPVPQVRRHHWIVSSGKLGRRHELELAVVQVRESREPVASGYGIRGKRPDHDALHVHVRNELRGRLLAR